MVALIGKAFLIGLTCGLVLIPEAKHVNKACFESLLLAPEMPFGAFDQSFETSINQPGQSRHELEKSNELVFDGRVLVPLKSCSIGMCAGFQAQTIQKGRLKKSKIILQIAEQDSMCQLGFLTKKGSRWRIYGNHGTTYKGFHYVRITKLSSVPQPPISLAD